MLLLIYIGSQVKHAEECGATGVMLYPDPSEVFDSGSESIEPYPDSRYLPSWSTRRGSLWRFGDPLTPSMPSRGINYIHVHSADKVCNRPAWMILERLYTSIITFEHFFCLSVQVKLMASCPTGVSCSVNTMRYTIT